MLFSQQFLISAVTVIEDSHLLFEPYDIAFALFCTAILVSFLRRESPILLSIQRKSYSLTAGVNSTLLSSVVDYYHEPTVFLLFSDLTVIKTRFWFKVMCLHYQTKSRHHGIFGFAINRS